VSDCDGCYGLRLRRCERIQRESSSDLSLPQSRDFLSSDLGPLGLRRGISRKHVKGIAGRYRKNPRSAGEPARVGSGKTKAEYRRALVTGCCPIITALARATLLSIPPMRRGGGLGGGGHVLTVGYGSTDGGESWIPFTSWRHSLGFVRLRAEGKTHCVESGGAGYRRWTGTNLVLASGFGGHRVHSH